MAPIIVCGEINYPFLSLGMDKLFHNTLFQACDYLSMLRLKLIYSGKSGYRKQELHNTVLFP